MKGPRRMEWRLQNRHGDVAPSTGGTANSVGTAVCGARRVLGMLIGDHSLNYTQV